MSNNTTKKKVLSRIARVEGQLRGIQKLIAEDADCEKIAQQMSAARKALEKSHHLMLSCMIEEQLIEAEHALEFDREGVTNLLSKYL